MNCSHPIKIMNKRGEYISVPCGQCLACRLNYGRDWAVRITAEAKLHEANIFLTLTYDDEHLPENNSLVKKHVSDFMKRLRKHVGQVRFFASGEYGDIFGRPHYHLIVFGLPINSPVFIDRVWDNKAKGYYCRCKCWPFGHCYVGNVTVDSARYVARYTVKKVKGKGSKEYYESLGLVPEFALMSRRPGIGAAYADKYADELSHFGTVMQNGKPCPLPRFFKERVDYAVGFDEMIEAMKKHNKWLGELPEHWTYSDLEEFRGNQQEDNLRKGLRK